jgi:protein-S-isoprenylcysteine O-methyltransferase Ste14
MIIAKAVVLRRNGINALKFGRIGPDFFVPVMILACFLYATFSDVLGLPLPAVARKLFWNSTVIQGIAILICTASIIWFGITLQVFGRSFRIGIDEKTNNRLITSGTFALSRNPVFVAFIAFFLGIFLSFPNMITLVYLVLLVTGVHLQIIKEEKFLIKHYGKEYERYCKNVRRYF